ncbi:hypothetical protein MACK_002858 [Theileria orientalis]|uniref:Uncharacterized protein n=1 Tax=Theileria orientalis TaxID=68886 RepID=A0A976ME55_THEOR|nr:hypothetical protein MACK_002858 [Theileria orientalis]
MKSFSNEGEFSLVDSKKNTVLKDFEYDLNDFNLNDFYKSVKHNKHKKSKNDNSILDKNKLEHALLENGNPNDERSKLLLSYKRSRLLNRIGSYKATYPSKMGIVEYLLHSYVVLFTPNPVTIYSYDAVFKNLSPDTEEFWNTIRTLTRVQLEVDKFPNDVPSHVSLLLESKESDRPFDTIDNNDSMKLDAHFTWLCKCCINVTGSKSDDLYDDLTEPNNEKKHTQEGVKTRSSKRVNNKIMLNKVFGKNYDLSSDILYEALRQKGNRYVQRSLYNNVKNMSSITTRGMNPNLAAKLNESNGRVKRFMDIIQQSSLDSSDPSTYTNYDIYGDERRHSSRRSMILRKKYS